MAERGILVDTTQKNKPESYIGKRSGRLVVTSVEPKERPKDKTKLRCICDCGQEAVVFIGHFQSGHTKSCGCGKSLWSGHRKDYQGAHFGKLTVLEKVSKTGEPTKYSCRCECGQTFVVSLSALLNGQTMCSKCSAAYTGRCNRKDYTGLVSDYGIEFIKPVGVKRSAAVWECRCGVCGSIFNATATRVWIGNIKSCGCIKSSREVLISNILASNNIKFIREKTFDSCKNNGTKLRFDFAIYRDNDLVCLIEYDGEQHFMPVMHWGGEKRLLETQKRDEIKNQFCIDNNIRLLRLPYTLTDDEIKTEIQSIIHP